MSSPDCGRPFGILHKADVTYDTGKYNNMDFLSIESENLGEQIKSICDE